MRIFWKILAAGFVACSTLGCSINTNDALAETPEKATIVGVGDVAPDFTVELLSGDMVTLSQMQGKTVLLVFFVTECPQCRSQLALLNSVLGEFGDRKFEVLAISRGEKKSAVNTFVQGKGYNFNIGIDPTAEVYSLYATEYVPRCFVIDSLGRVVALSAEYNKEEFELLVKVINSLTMLGSQQL